MLNEIEIVLSNTTHPGNIGATARAMKVMGLSRLKLVSPRHFPSAEATQRASRADDILANAQVFDGLPQAVASSRLIIGTSARTRNLDARLVTPRELVEIIASDPERKPVSFLFGTENSGLTNSELSLCHYHVYIPTNPDYSSLNLASAVQLIAYELRLGLLALGEPDSGLIPASGESESEKIVNREQLQGLLAHFDQVMQQTGYLVPAHGKPLDVRMNRLFNRADITLSELNILRGFLSSVNKYCERLDNQRIKDQTNGV